MNNTFIIILFSLCFFTIGNGQQKKSQDYFKEINLQIKQKNYFKARDIFNQNGHKMNNLEQLITEVYIDNAFNRLLNSNHKIEILFREYKDKLIDSLKLNLYITLQDNSSKLYEYKQAKSALDSVLIHYPHLLSIEEQKNYQNDRNLWEILENQPKQELENKENCTLKMERDQASLLNIKVRKEDELINFVFDTGANISTITETTAEKLNIKFLEGTITVDAITGNKVESRLAICPELFIGNILIKNSIFLVFKDEDLAFPQIQYQINGIIGYPIIEAMKEIQITKNDELIIPKVFSESQENNLALYSLTPIVQIEEDYYTFDTGATQTILYQKYFEKYKQEIQNKYEEIEIRFGGAGGVVARKGYNISFSPIINGKKIVLQDIFLFKEKQESTISNFYGNIGQDLIKKYDKITLNFESMFILFDK